MKSPDFHWTCAVGDLSLLLIPSCPVRMVADACACPGSWTLRELGAALQAWWTTLADLGSWLNLVEQSILMWLKQSYLWWFGGWLIILLTTSINLLQMALFDVRRIGQACKKSAQWQRALQLLSKINSLGQGADASFTVQSVPNCASETPARRV